jgi:hypothetical protein
VVVIGITLGLLQPNAQPTLSLIGVNVYNTIM